MQNQLSSASQNIVAEGLEPLTLTGHADAAHLDIALTAARFRVHVAQIPATVLLGLIIDEARIAPTDFIVTAEQVFPTLDIRFKDQVLETDRAVQIDARRSHITRRIPALQQHIGVQIGRDIFRRGPRLVRATALEQRLDGPLGRIDTQHQNRQLVGVIFQTDACGVDLFGRKGLHACQARRQLRLRLGRQQGVDQLSKALAVDDEPVVARQQHRHFAQNPAVEVQRHRHGDVAVVRVDVGPLLLRFDGLAAGERLTPGRCSLAAGGDLRTCAAGRRHGCGQGKTGRGPRYFRPPLPHRANRKVTGLAGSSSTPVGTLKVRRPPPGAR
ncbi:hypothetical protein D3C80_1007920 [compost metagenome]